MNQLKVNQQQTIVSLIEQGWSKRRIARELGLDRATVRKHAGASKPATNPNTGSAGPESSCEPLCERIEKAWNTGLSVQRILQDLISEEGSEGSYSSVRRFVRRLPGDAPELPFRRMECEPGRALQVDFAQGA